MTAAWLLYGIAVAGLLGCAGWLAESGLRVLGRQARWVWVAALVGSVAVPAAAWFGWPEIGGGSGGVIVGSAAVVPEAYRIEPRVASPVAGVLNRVLPVLWVASSWLVVAAIVSALVRLWRARAGWRREVVDGVPVLLSRDEGPAALGFWRGAIVVPAWALSLDVRLRRLMLLHEEEHVRAGDPRLLLIALLGPVLMPWNPAVWWQLGRLRQAMELDCDGRVLRRAPDVRGYGALLLEVGRRKGVGRLVVAAFVGSRPFLERRILMLARSKAGASRVRAWLGLAAAAGLVVVACEAPEPTRTLETDDAKPLKRPIAGGVSSMAGRVGAAAAGEGCRPLVLVDGVPTAATGAAGGGGSLQDAILSTIDPARIRSVEVVKGAAAERVFGGRFPKEDLRCGVVQITTDAAAEGAVSMEVGAASSVDRSGPAGFRSWSPGLRQPELKNRAEVARALEMHYPPLLRDAGVGGTAVVRVWIDDRGEVVRVQVGTSSGHDVLDAAAVKVAELMRFDPARDGGAPVAVVTDIPIVFRAQTAG